MGDSKHYSYPEIELKSESLLKRLRDLEGRDLDLPINIDAIIERVLDLKLEYRTLPSDPKNIILAKYTPSNQLIQINEGQLPLFQTYTYLERTVKGHEVGHFVLHDDSHPHEYNFSKRTNSPIEREAHQFSACLLIPKEIIKKLLPFYDFRGWRSFLEIGKKLGVTKQMLKLRLKELGIFKENTKGEFIGPGLDGFNFGTLKNGRYI